MTYETKTRKGHDGWKAESRVRIGESAEGRRRMLSLTTSKYRGDLAACATVFVIAEDGARITEFPGDFRKWRIALTECKRATERAVLEVHNRALLEMPAIIEEAKAFYETNDKEAA